MLLECDGGQQPSHLLSCVINLQEKTKKHKTHFVHYLNVLFVHAAIIQEKMIVKV